MTDFIYYPELTDENFYKRLYPKKEFIDYHDNEDEKRTCDKKKFKIQNTQSIIRNYLSESTIYNGLLLFHGTGSGKTCSSILIAENYLNNDDIKSNKKVYIISSEKLHPQFKKEIYNPDKIPSQQCLSNKYFLYRNGKIDQKEIDKKISENYKFTTYEKFYKGVIKDLFEIIGDSEFKKFKNKVTNENYLENYKDKDIKKIIKDKYSNKVFIIDEIQNIKDEKDSSINLKIITLKFVLKYGENNKLVIMSATPMFDKPEEIIFNINLLLLNDKRAILNEDDYMEIINTEDEMTYKTIKEDKINDFKEKIKGYISYVRGDDTNLFPKRDFKGTLDYTITKNALNNKEIPENKRLSNIKLVLTKIGNTEQFKKYKEVNNSNLVKKEQSLLQISNFYNNNTLDNMELYHYDRKLKEYSVKFYEILKQLKTDTTNGINLIYTREIDLSLYPLIKALYINGYEFYNKSTYTDLIFIDEKYNNEIKNNRICVFCNKQKREHNNNMCPIGNTKFRQAKMVVFHGKIKHKDIIEDTLGIINNNVNKVGENIKLILGTDVISEGVDFKRIQNIHIVEPWHNLSKMDQIIGRGSRFCSHADLDEKDRKVNIFLYALYFDNIDSYFNNNRESIDLLRYRRGINKDKAIKKINRILKRSAIDCNYNKINNIKQILGYDNTRLCDYEDCEYKCEYTPEEEIEIDTDTYKIIFSYSDVIYVINLIDELFKSGYIELSRTDIIDKIDYKNEDIIDYALNRMIKTKYILKNKFNVPGYLKYNKFKEPEGVYYFTTEKYDKDELEDDIYINMPEKFSIEKVLIKSLKKEFKISNYYDEFKDTYKKIITKYSINEGHSIGVYIACYMYNKTPILQSMEADIELFKYYYEEYNMNKETKLFNNFYKLYIEKVLGENSNNFIINDDSILYKDRDLKTYKLNKELNKFEDIDIDLTDKEMVYKDYYIEYNVKDNKYILKNIINNSNINFSNTSNTSGDILKKELIKINSDIYVKECNNETDFFYKKKNICIKISTTPLLKYYLIREGIVNKKIKILY